LSLAHQLALDSHARFQMARALLDRGLRDQAAEQYRIILRTAPPGHLQWHEATRLLGEHLMDTQPEIAADWLDFSILDDLRPYFHLIELNNYLRTPALIHRLRAVAAVEGRRRRNRSAAGTAGPGRRTGRDADRRGSRSALDAAGHRQAANRLFDEQFQAHVQWCEDWPDSAMLNNNLAWLAARCGRRLDDALHTLSERSNWNPMPLIWIRWRKSIFAWATGKRPSSTHSRPSPSNPVPTCCRNNCNGSEPPLEPAGQVLLSLGNFTKTATAMWPSFIQTGTLLPSARNNHHL
jgi:hypothetical protein